MKFNKKTHAQCWWKQNYPAAIWSCCVALTQTIHRLQGAFTTSSPSKVSVLWKSYTQISTIICSSLKTTNDCLHIYNLYTDTHIYISTFQSIYKNNALQNLSGRQDAGDQVLEKNVGVPVYGWLSPGQDAINVSLTEELRQVWWPPRFLFGSQNMTTYSITIPFPHFLPHSGQNKNTITFCHIHTQTHAHTLSFSLSLSPPLSSFLQHK